MTSQPSLTAWVSEKVTIGLVRVSEVRGGVRIYELPVGALDKLE